MKKILTLSITLLTIQNIFSSNAVTTQAPKPSPKNSEIKTKVIEGGSLLKQSDEGKDIEKKLQDLQRKMKSEIDVIEQKIRKDVTDLTSKAKVLDADTLEREQERIMKLKNEHENKSKQAQEDFQRAFNREIGKFQKKVNDEVKDMAIKNGWDLVVMREGGDIIYMSEKVDATSDLLKALNKKYNESKTPAKPATPPAKK